MKVTIWSDIRCPFCYIGKRKFEIALKEFPQKEKIEVEWKSFELDPSLETQKDKDVYDYLAEKKGQTRLWSEKVHAQVTQTAREVGLEYNFDKAIVATSFDAHRLIQLAKTKGLADVVEERLFKAYFTEGKDISDHKTLKALGKEVGLTEDAVQQMLASTAYSKEVRNDEAEAQAIGVNGVPFFVFNNQYAVSGAQAPAVFKQVLEKAWNEYEKTSAVTGAQYDEGAACTVDSNC